MAIALRIVVIAAWAGFVLAMASWSNTDAALIGAGTATIALGALVGRWWVLLVPVVPGALLALGTLVADPDGFYEGSPELWAAYLALITVAFAALVAIGVALNRLTRRVRLRSSA